MRSTSILLLSLVFLVCAGACAGRQRPQQGLHSETRQTAPNAPDPDVRIVPNDTVDTKISLPEAPTTSDEVAASVVTKKPVPPRAKRVRSVQERPSAEARRVTDTDAARPQAERARTRGTHVPAALPDNDATVIAMRAEPGAPPHRSDAPVAQATVEPDPFHAPPSSSSTQVAFRDTRTRPLTPLSPRERERANAAALAALESPISAATNAAQPAPTAPSEPASVISATDTTSRRLDAAIADSEPSSATQAGVSTNLYVPSAPESASSSRLYQYVPAIIVALLLGILIGYVLSRLPARGSSFDDDIYPDVDHASAGAHAPESVPVSEPAPVQEPVPVLVVPSPASSSVEAMPPTQFPEGSGSIVTSAGPDACSSVSGEIELLDSPAPQEAPTPPTTETRLN
ncbi:MAG: hypothetical protein QY323_00265 [Patescibacteria group bacterium]|nr:MAG: hypothetical protein QY323_00265 [Patescibacteria group bacterium]